MLLSRRPLRFATLEPAACLICQWRTFTTSGRRFAAQGKAPPIAKPSSPSVLDEAPKSYGPKQAEEFVPKPLNRPIGLPKPPRAGENTGIDGRSWRQRRDDFVNYDKHIARRKELTRIISKPYFRDWSNIGRQFKGKSFLAPPRLFKAERALFFPNFYGQTLLEDKIPRDTTPVFEDKISVVSVFSSAWAENQAATFTSARENPELHEVVKGSEGAVQLVQINIETDPLKAWLVRLFMPRLRRKFEFQNWARYFLVRKGITDEIRDSVGLLNSKVGYTYLLDGACRIRWAGSGLCFGDEKERLVQGVKWLIEESKAHKKEMSAPPSQRWIAQEGQVETENQKVAAAAAP